MVFERFAGSAAQARTTAPSSLNTDCGAAKRTRSLTLGATAGLATVLLPAAFSAAFGQTFTEPLETAQSGDITLESGETIELPSGVAVTINSDNVLVNNGAISVTGDTGGVGVRAESGFTGGVTNAGTITLVSADADADPLGSDKTGVLVSGGEDAFTGPLTFEGGSSIRVEGSASVGVLVETPLVGDIVHSGRIDLNGENTIGILIDAPVEGSVEIDSGAVAVWGPDARGVQVADAISGSLINGGTIDLTGVLQDFRDDPQSTEDDDLTKARAVIEIGADLGEGFINAGSGPEGEPGVRVGSAVIDGNVVEFGVLVTPVAENNVTLNAAGTEGSAYGFINRGTLTVDAFDEGDPTAGIRIEGSVAGAPVVTTTVEGGLLNTGTVNTTSVDAPTAAISIGANAIVPEIVNEGAVSASATGTIGGTSHAILIEEGASVSRIENSGALAVETSGTDAGAIVIEDRSGGVTEIVNSGSISFSLSEAGSVSVPEDAARIAIDLSATTADVTITNSGGIGGALLLGDGNDILNIVAPDEDSSFASLITGDIDTGGGADQIVVSGGSALTGSIINSDGTLDLTVEDAQVLVTPNNVVSVTNLSVGAEGELTVFVSGEDTDQPRITATDTVTLEETASVEVALTDFFGESAEITIIDAATLLLDDTVTLSADDVSILYTSVLDVSGGNDSDLVLTLDLKTPEELGLNNNQTAAFPSLVDALAADPFLATALGNLETTEDFQAAYNQLLPDSGLRARTIAVTLTDQTTAVINTRLDAMRAVTVDSSPTAWFQIFGSVYTQDPILEDFGFDGETYSIAGGFDYPWLGANALGISFVWSGSRISEMDSLDEDLIADTIQLGLYGSWSFGNMFFDVQGFAGYNKYRETRRVEFDGFIGETDGDWDGYQYSANARVGYDLIFGNNVLTPTFGFDYLQLHENAQFETSANPGLALRIEERETTSARAVAGLEYSRIFERRRGGRLVPSARIGYRYELETDPVVSVASFVESDETFEIASGEIEQNGLTGGAGISFSGDTVIVDVSYDVLLEEDLIRHSGGLTFRFLFGR